MCLEETADLSGVAVEVDIVDGRASGQAGNGHHGSDDGEDESCTGAHAHLAHAEGEISRDTLGSRVRTQTQLD